MDSMYMLMDLLFVGCGVYVLYAFYLMKTKGEIKENVLLSRDISVSKCKDKAGYIKYMTPRLLVFGIVLLIIGIVSLIGDYFKIWGMGSLIILAIGLIVMVWFVMITRKSMKIYW